MMKGYRTVAVNGLIAALIGSSQYLLGVNWQEMVSPNAAMIITLGINVLLRIVTTTKIGQKD
jgi:hypothetical protein